MFFSKYLIALAAIATATASPTKRDDTTTCSFILHPNVPVDSATVNLFAEFNYAIGRTLGLAVPSHQIYGGKGATWVDNGDNTFDVQDTIAAVGETSASTATIINGWTGTSLLGLTANWLVESVSCI
ncbi:hypothetical protein BDZ94DRAFT_1260397 [Collybia nuda]|uniref:Uncharacterized protein n=1 Tax=Collybia nuda TaxID=64659 RepID=A0A9P6CJH6_9AGAR|nr:hypothetical protein BDZ94DRAFT_1260397 [Collybia nuda]